MGCFRMGQWAPRRPMASEGKTPFAAGEPEPLAVGFDRLRSGESSLVVSDRAVGPGQQRPSPRWGATGASCSARSVCAKACARDVRGVYSSLGEHIAAAARQQRSVMGRLSRTKAAVGREHGSATARPPGRERSMAGTRMRNGLPIGAGWCGGWQRCWRRLRCGSSAARRFLRAGACGRAAFLQA